LLFNKTYDAPSKKQLRFETRTLQFLRYYISKAIIKLQQFADGNCGTGIQ